MGGAEGRGAVRIRGVDLEMEIDGRRHGQVEIDMKRTALMKTCIFLYEYRLR